LNTRSLHGHSFLPDLFVKWRLKLHIDITLSVSARANASYADKQRNATHRPIIFASQRL